MQRSFEHHLFATRDGTLGMKHLVDFGNRCVPDRVGAVDTQLGRFEFGIPCLATMVARTVSGGERGRLVEKEKLGVRTLIEYWTSNFAKPKRTGHPGLASPGPNDLACLVMKDAPVAHE